MMFAKNHVSFTKEENVSMFSYIQVSLKLRYLFLKSYTA